MQTDDESIIGLFFERSEDAIRELDRKYGSACQALAFHILNNRSDAEECVNDAYLAVWNAIPPAKPDPLSAFVLKIVRNLSLKRYERNTAAKRNSLYDVAMEELEDCLPAEGGPDDELKTEELARVIEDFLDSLTEENRVIFMRRYWFSDPYEEIAARVGLTKKNVSVRLTRIRKELRDFLKKRGI